MADIEFADLLLDTGEIVRLEFPDTVMDEVYEALEHAMKRRDWWSPQMFDSCQAMFLGHHLGRVNMARVVGML